MTKKLFSEALFSEALMRGVRAADEIDLLRKDIEKFVDAMNAACLSITNGAVRIDAHRARERAWDIEARRGKEDEGVLLASVESMGLPMAVRDMVQHIAIRHGGYPVKIAPCAAPRLAPQIVCQTTSELEAALQTLLEDVSIAERIMRKR